MGRGARIATRQGLLALALMAAATPAYARQEVRIGIGAGLAFLPAYLCADLKLVEKHAKAAGLDVKVSYPRFSGAHPMQDAIRSGAVDMGPFGVSALLSTWEKTKGTRQQLVAVSGLTTLPLVLVTNRPHVKSIKDLKPTDRIAVPASVSPQTYLLEMAAEKAFGVDQRDKLRSQLVVLPHRDSVDALASSGSDVTAYFSSAPFTEAALKHPKVHTILTSSDVIGGKASFLVMAATRRYVEANPKLPDVIAKAMDEAAQIIRTDPRKAAAVYLTHEPSKTLDVATVAAVLKELKDEFGSPIQGVQAYADFMGKLGELKSPPKSWKDVVSRPVADMPGS